MIVGVDFGAPQRARDQRRKIIAIGAQPTGRHSYRIDVTGMNARLLANNPPGWTAQELTDELMVRPVRVVAFDFPFSVPRALLSETRFAADVGYRNGAFKDWRSFNRWVAACLPFTDPIDFASFAPWREPSERARLWTKRATDVAARGQPPLKNKFQATFQMTLLGNSVLAKLWESHKYRILPFPGGSGEGEVIEVYPGATTRTMGIGKYKSCPDEAIRLGIAACAAAGIHVHVDHRLIDLACRYSSSGPKKPDHDVADAFIAAFTAVLYAEGACRPAFALGLEAATQPLELEGAIWVPILES